MSINRAAGIAVDGVVHLPDWALLRAHGADAEAFLQGQLTQDVAVLQPGQARLAGYCNAKGRLLASFVIWRMNSDEFGLLCSADVAAVVRKRLSMHVLRARCRVDDASSEWQVHGAAGDSAVGRAPREAQPWRASQREAQWVIGLPPVDQVPRFVLVQPATMQIPA